MSRKKIKIINENWAKKLDKTLIKRFGKDKKFKTEFNLFAGICGR